jgi:hypothetical protein
MNAAHKAQNHEGNFLIPLASLAVKTMVDPSSVADSVRQAQNGQEQDKPALAVAELVRISAFRHALCKSSRIRLRPPGGHNHLE